MATLDLSALDFGGDAPASDAPRSEKAPTAHISEFVLARNVRGETDPVKDAEMTADFRERGIMSPVLCSRGPDGKLHIHQGSTRYRLAPAAGIDHLPYIVTEDPRHLDGYAQVAENAQRQSLTPLDLARFIHERITDHKEQKKTVAAKLNIDPSTLTHLVSLLEAPDFIMELYHSGKCRTPKYLWQLNGLWKKNPKLVEGRVAAAEVIDRATLAEITEELEPKSVTHAAPPSPGTPRDPMPSEGADKDGDKGGDADGSAGDGNSSGGPEVQTGAYHNPDLEKTEGRPSDPDKLKKPLLLGKVDGREVMVLLTKRPTKLGLVHVKYEDGSGEIELSLDRLTLTQLSDSKKD